MTPVLNRTTWKVAVVPVPKRGTPLHVTVSRSDSELAKTPFPAAAAAGFQACQRTAIFGNPSAIRSRTVEASPTVETPPPDCELKWIKKDALPKFTYPLELMKTLA